MKKLLILGANPETASLVKKANEMGIITYVTDYNPNAYAKKFASVPCNIDASDVEKIIELVKKENIDSVMVGVSEALIPVYCEMCAKLDIPCFANMEQFEIMIAKDRFKQVCRKYDVPVVPEYSLENLDEIVFPVVVKPVDSCSSKGISICKNRAELDLGIEKALEYSRSGNLLVERYMTGDEVVIYYVIQEGVPSLVAMCDRYANKEQAGVAQLPTSYIYPSRYLKGYIEKTNDNVCAMLRGMKIQNGVLFLQAFVENGEVRVYEPGFRLNGAQEHILVSYVTGIDAKELMINHAMSGKISDKNIADMANPGFDGKWACKLSPLVKEGKIAKIEGLEEIKEIPGVISVNPSYEEGDIIEGKGTLRQIVCRFYVVCDTKIQLKETLDKVTKLLHVYNDKGEDMMLSPFDTDVILTRY